ncbi:DNRLRE domain-containing protein [Jeotgalibacillus salarius]|uniref:Fibronectin type III domain-containing protein n=1 Tax=Jeotgalibacillus salarius TaxID=546023 RepID=A0A4Y8LIN4_9BACL|nr:DNRLRE domain-containing protein [Jeotgalibacillus salarius]TFE02890.1 fibronectin type III domain-containing protein [Jeotgalibacillus salarius]
MPTNNFKVGEMMPKRTRNSKTWMNFDGSYTTEIFQSSVHYEDEQGNLHNINTDLYDEADFDIIEEPVTRESKEDFKRAKEVAKAAKQKKVMNRDQYGFRGLNVPFDVKIPRNFKKGYSIGKGQDKLTFIPVGASPSKGELHSTDRSTITYQDVWNDADVELKVIPDGLKETIILKTDRAPSSFSFEVKGKEFTEDLRAGQLKLAPAWLLDAAGTERDVEQAIVQENNKTYVQLTADVTGLVYPIEIDPTVTINDQNLMKDAYIFEGSASNYGSNVSVIIGSNSTATRYYTYIQCDLSFIPNDAKILNAELQLTAYNWGNKAVNSWAEIVLDEWQEATISQPNKPSVNDTRYGQYSLSGLGVKSWNITEIVDQWANEETPNYGVRLNSDNVDAYFQFRSKESSYTSARPKLVVNYNTLPTSPILLNPNGGETWNSLHTIAWKESEDNTETTITEYVKTGGLPFATWMSATTGNSGQVMEVTENQYISEIGMYLRCINPDSYPYNFTMRLVGVNETTKLPDGVIYHTETVQALNNAEIYYRIGIPSRLVKLPIGTKVAIEINDPEGKMQHNYGNAEYQKGWYYYGTTVSPNNPGNDYLAYIKYEIWDSASIQYNLQLSIDNGGNYTNLIGLTSPGATSYDYDFINEPETSTAKLRIRAYDGYDYSEWDESDGVFTIQHNQAPAAPINLSPAGGQSRDRAQTIRLSWQHNDPDSGDPQSKYDLQWRLRGSFTWNEVSQVTVNQYHDISGLPYGEIEWRIRTYDQAELSSPYSDIQVFFAGNKPAMPTITNYSQGSTIAVANPTIQWSSSGQTGYRLQVKDEADSIVWTDERTSMNKAVTANAGLENEENYSIELSIKNSDGLWSDPHVINVLVSYTPPAVPTLSISGNGYAATIQLQITNPDPVGTEPYVTHHNVFRRKSGEASWTRIANAVPLNGSFTDYTPGHDQTYQYYVKAYGNNETYCNSGTVSESINLQSIWLMDPDDTGSLYHFEYFEPGRSAERMLSGQVTAFEGRAHPMAEFSPRQQSKVIVVLQIERESDDLEALHNLLSRQTTLLYRDARGRRMFGVIFMLPETETDWGYNVPIEFIQVDYEEDI